MFKDKFLTVYCCVHNVDMVFTVCNIHIVSKFELNTALGLLQIFDFYLLKLSI